MNKFLVVVAAIAIVLFSFAQKLEHSASENVHQGDLIISGNDVYEIKDSYIQNGNVLVKDNAILHISGASYVQNGDILIVDNAALNINNAIFTHNPNLAARYNLRVQENGRLEVINSAVRADRQVNWIYTDQSHIVFDNVASDRLLQHTACDNPKVIIKNAPGRLTVEGAAVIDISNSSEVYLTLTFGPNSKVDITLPRDDVSQWEFPREGDIGISYKVRVQNSTFTHWGVRCCSDSEVTIRDSNLTVAGFDIGLTKSGAVEELANLRGSRKYNDNTFIVDTARLNLVNTAVAVWYPRAHGDSQLTISDSPGFGSIDGSTGRSRIIVNNSGAGTVEAADEVEVMVLNSGIHTNVVAKENSKILIVDSWISHGGIMAYGNGVIHVNSSRVDASFLEADDNSIIQLTNSNVPSDVRTKKSGKVYVYWTLTVLVIIDNQPQQGAAVTVKWPDGKLAASRTTGQNGSATFTLIDKIITADGTTNLKNYTIAASYHDRVGEQNIELDGSKTAAIELEKIGPNYLLILTFVSSLSVAVIFGYILIKRKAIQKKEEKRGHP